MTVGYCAWLSIMKFIVHRRLARYIWFVSGSWKFSQFWKRIGICLVFWQAFLTFHISIQCYFFFSSPLLHLHRGALGVSWPYHDVWSGHRPGHVFQRVVVFVIEHNELLWLRRRSQCSVRRRWRRNRWLVETQRSHRNVFGARHDRIDRAPPDRTVRLNSYKGTDH